MSPILPISPRLGFISVIGCFEVTEEDSSTGCIVSTGILGSELISKDFFFTTFPCLLPKEEIKFVISFAEGITDFLNLTITADNEEAFGEFLNNESKLPRLVIKS